MKEMHVVFSNSGGNIDDYDLPRPAAYSDDAIGNRMVEEELALDSAILVAQAASMIPMLNVDQRNVFDTIMQRVNDSKPGFFFVYGHGGTGKTFLWNTLICKIRSEKKIVLAVASSGVASLLLPRGRTAHSRFKIRLKLMKQIPQSKGEPCLLSLLKKHRLLYGMRLQ